VHNTVAAEAGTQGDARRDRPCPRTTLHRVGVTRGLASVGSGQPAVGRLVLLHWQHVGDGGIPATAAGEENMSWKRPKIREICIGMEINGYLPADL